MNAPVPDPVAPLAEAGQRITVKPVLRELVLSDWLKSSEADAVYKLIRQQTRELHPLTAIAETRTRASGGRKAGQMMTGDLLAEWLSQRVGLDYFHIDPLRIDFTRIGDVMSSAYATRYEILPVEVRQDEILIATSEPYVVSWMPEISQVTRKTIRRVISNPADITRYIVEFYNLAKSVKSANKIGVGTQQNFEQLVHLGNQLASGGRAIDQNDAHIVQIVDWLWQYAYEQRASDIHLEPRRDAGHVRFRIDGVLHQVYQVPPTVIAAMTARIKLLGRMDVVEKRRPQDGRIKTKNPSGQEIELRLSTLPTAFGEKLVMRIFDPEVLVKDFTQLGFSEEDIARWQTMTSQPNGIILVTGPTGSGKTTTLYSTLKQLATEEVNVCTVEDPIEMVEPSFNQMQIQHGIELSFADGLRALMRQDPDIIMVGEIRDLETAEMAIQASLTGHLVLSTLHTNDAPSAVSRLLELGVPPYLLNATLLGVMAQRLVRTLCPHCKQPHEQTPARELWDDMIRPYNAEPPARFYKPVGCLECRMTGYRGRHGIYESLLMTDDMRRLVHSAPDISAIRRMAMKQGMKTLRVSGATKIAAGITTMEEVLKAAPSADDLSLA
jgi:general secretion pathway protein E